MSLVVISFLFFFNDTATTEIYTLSLHDALPISSGSRVQTGEQVVLPALGRRRRPLRAAHQPVVLGAERSEEHTSELQSRQYLVCRLLLEKKKNKYSLILVSSVLNTSI